MSVASYNFFFRGHCILSFEKHLGFLCALYQILIKVLIRNLSRKSIFGHRNMAIFQDSKSVWQFFNSQKVQKHVFNKSNFINHDE